MRASIFLILYAFIIFFLLRRIISFAMNRGRPTVKPPDNFKMEFFDVFSNMERSRGKSQEKSLNCLFQYEGLTRDAYEVLGVPAGAPLELCRGVFRDRLRTETGKSLKLLEEAMGALEKRS